VKTKIIRPRQTERNWADEVIRVLHQGEPVALPTETVYGLAADALNAEAVAKIFEAKERPHFDPLIVHLPDRDWLEKVVDLPALATASPSSGGQDRQLILKLTQRFWPGPFTIVLPKRPIIPDLVTAGLDTVAVRISAHPVFSEIVRAFGQPLAAPSANRFGRVSPTTAQHVIEELHDRIPLVVDAGPTRHGIESTIVAIHNSKIDILRRGPITEAELSQFGKIDIVTSRDKISAPGQLSSHYAPKTPMHLIDDAKAFSPEGNQRVALLAWNPTSRKDDFPVASAVENRRSLEFVAIRHLSERNDLREAAANLFRYLRELDSLDDVDLIVAERVPEIGLGAAIMDRLRRAAHRQSDKQDMPARIL
jgi:L-threonylcarbamoyladenylate synthase